MANAKAATLRVRIEPSLKDVIRTAGDHEHRSNAGMVQVISREHFGKERDSDPRARLLMWRNLKAGQQLEAGH